MNSESLQTLTNDLIVATLEALLAECDLIASNEHTLDAMELFFLDKGRKFLQETFQEKLQERVQRVETDPASNQCPHCKKKHTTKTRSRKTSLPFTEM